MFGKYSTLETRGMLVWRRMQQSAVMAAIAGSGDLTMDEERCANEALRRADFNDLVGLGTLDRLAEKDKKPLSSLVEMKKQLVEMIPLIPYGASQAKDKKPADSLTVKKDGNLEWKPEKLQVEKIIAGRNEELAQYRNRNAQRAEGLIVAHSELIQQGMHGVNGEPWTVLKDVGVSKWDDVLKPDASGKRTLGQHLGRYVAEQLKQYQMKWMDIPIVAEECGHIAEDRLRGLLGLDRLGVEWKGKNARLDASAQAALARYTYGATLTGAFEPFKLNVKVNAKGSAQVALAEGKMKTQRYYPARDGWLLRYESKKTKKHYPLGAMRIELHLAAEGVVGACLAAEIGVDLSRKDAQSPLVVSGRPESHPPERSTLASALVGNKTVAQSKGALDVFVGAKVGVEIEGALQWRNPENRDKAFEDLARLGVPLSGRAGAGVSGSFGIDYVGGKFRVKMSGGFCWGIGFGAGVEIEIGIVEIGAFLKCFYYMLYNSDFELLEEITEDAFDAWKYLLFLTVVYPPVGVAVGVVAVAPTVLRAGKKVSDRMESIAKNAELVAKKYFGKEIRAIETEFKGWCTRFEAETARARMRKELAVRIATWQCTETLKYAMPEVRGMLIYRLMQQSTWAADAMASRDISMDEERRAILEIFRHVQTKQDFRNTVQHIHPEGKKCDYDSNYQALYKFLSKFSVLLGTPEGKQLKEFQRNLRDRENVTYDDAVIIMGVGGLLGRLKEAPTPGEPVFPNDTMEYDLQRDDLHRLWGEDYYSRVC